MLGDKGVHSSQTAAVRRSDDVLALRLKVSELERMVRCCSLQGLPGGQVGGGRRLDSGGEGGCWGIDADNGVHSASSSRSHIVAGRTGHGGNYVVVDEVSRMEERLAMLEGKHRKREQELQTQVEKARAQV